MPKPDPILDVAVKFGQVGFGDKSGGLPVTIERTEMSLAVAGDMLCGRRLFGRVKMRPADEQEGQSHLLDDGNVKSVEGVFDVSGFRVSPKAISCRAVFALDAAEYEELVHFGNKKGRLIVDMIAKLDHDEPAEVDEPGE